MKKMNNLAIVAILFLGTLTLGCKSYVVFDQKLVDSQGWTSEDLSRIQFYTSDYLEISRELEEGKKTEITSGKVLLVDGKNTQRVIFPAKTKGVYLFETGVNKIALQLEPIDESHFLVFGANPAKGMNGRYTLFADSWNGRQSGVVTYGENKFTASFENVPYLLIQKRSIENKKITERVAKGVRVKS